MSGTKAVRIRRIIGYFANLITKEVSEEASPGERFYKYLPELARRDRENLLAMSRATEKCTLLAIEKCTAGTGSRGGSEATGAGTGAWI